MRSVRVAIALAILLLPGAMLAPVWRLGGLGAGEDDILYYYPSRTFFHESIRSGEWPWLNPWTGLDRPFMADPQSAVWYPPTWLFALLPPQWAYPASLWLHYSLAIWGAYRLLRGQSLGRGAALLGGSIFAFSGFLLAHRAHFAMQHAAAWAPWVFWRMARYVESDRSADIRRLAAAAGVAALQCLSGHVQVAALTALGTLTVALSRGPLTTGATPRRIALLRWVLVWLATAGLYAIQWVPTAAYVVLCTRVDRTYRDFVENSWSIASALGWLLPMIFGQRTPNFFPQAWWGPSHQTEQFAYAGIVPLILAALALRGAWHDPRRRPWVVLLVLALLTALGKYGPVCPLLYWLPGSGLFRVPARALLLFHLATAVLAAWVVNELTADLTPQRARLRATLQRWTRSPLAAGVGAVLAAALVLLASSAFLPSATRAAALAALWPGNPALWVPVVVAVVSLAALGSAARRFRQPNWLWLPALVALLDLGVIGWTMDVPRGVLDAEALRNRQDQDWLAAIRESGQRLWVVTDTHGVYADPLALRVPNTNSLAHVASLADYGPLQPRALRARFAFTPWGVSDRALDLLHDTSWMERFHVGWILLARPGLSPPTGCAYAGTTDAGWPLFRRTHPTSMTQPDTATYRADGAQRFTVALAGPLPARLAIARLGWPGWHARNGRQPIPVRADADGLMELSLAGLHPGPVGIYAWYEPPGLTLGIVISVLTAAGLLVAAAQRRFLQHPAHALLLPDLETPPPR